MYALLLIDTSVIKKESGDTHERSFSTNNFLAELSDTVRPDTEDEKVLESALLFDIDSGLSSLRHSLSIIEGWKVPYKLLMLTEKPKFIT